MVLAHVGRADALVTGDRDLLALRADFPDLIITPDALRARVDEGRT